MTKRTRKQKFLIFLSIWLLVAGSISIPLLRDSGTTSRLKTGKIACDSITSPDSRLSREQAMDLILISERSQKAELDKLPAPYCKLEPIQLRRGDKSLAERRLYLLDFNPDGAIVTMIEGDEYLAFSFWVANRDVPKSDEVGSIALAKSFDIDPNQAIGAGNVRVSGGLGDISLNLNGDSLYAPVEGELLKSDGGCHLFISRVLPGYRIRLCGLGDLENKLYAEGERIGEFKTISVALLRREPTGNYVFVEPAGDFLRRLFVESGY
ncbi:hypothetical protein GC174_08745 [bacterium]|nr:hypothetical protein [bacterium]